MISVIIPVFDVAPHLEECLRAIVAQTFSDWECILIDDGSTDASGEICDKWAGIEARIMAIHQQNAGVSAARNRGLDVARGEYIAFVDSDDTIDPSYFSALHGAVDSSDADLAVCGLEIRDGDGSSIHRIPRSNAVFPLDRAHLSDFLELERDSLLYGPVVKLYRRQIIEDRHLRFDETKNYGEDLLFNLSYLRYCKSIVTISEALYCYIRRNDSLSTRFREDMFEINYAQWHELMAFHQDKSLYDEASAGYLYTRLWGIVYDSVFAFPKCSDANLSYLQRLLSIPEITQMKSYQREYSCAAWIKRWILGRRARLFYWYFKLNRR